MRTIPALLLAAGLLGGASTAGADGDPAAGAQKSQTCASCHGENGRSENTTYPMLAGQYESYLYQALKQYKSGERQNAVMSGMVSNLSDQDMQDLAAYYATREPAVYTAPRGGGE